MSTLHIRQLKSYFRNSFDGLIDLSDIRDAQEDKENNFNSRSTALFSLFIETGVEIDILKDWIVDGFDDNGIDAIYFDTRTKTLYLIQSKWHNDGNGSIDRGSIQKFLKGVKDILNGRFEKFNEKVSSKSRVINTALDDPQTKICLITSYSGKDKLSDDVSGDISDFLDEQNDPAEIITHLNHNLSRLYQALVVGAQGSSIQQDVLIYGWNTIKEPNFAVYGQLAASDAAAWLSEHGYSLFAPNIRVFLGETSVNDGIINSLIESPDNFWYFNNGITALCSSIDKKPIGGSSHESGTFKCSDLRIVNGAQTVGSITKAFANDPDQVAKAKVQIRIISLEDTLDTFEKDITRTNNTQNRIDSRDFVSLDSNQLRLRTELLIEGIEYVYKTGESFRDKESGFDFIEAALARVCSAGTIEMAVVAKGNIGRLWEDIDKAPYKILFNPTVTGPKLWADVKILRIIDSKISEIRDSKWGRERLVAVHGNRSMAYKTFQDLPSEIRERETLTESDIKLIRDMVQSKYDSFLERTNEFFPDSYPASIFKNTSKTKLIAE